MICSAVFRSTIAGVSLPAFLISSSIVVEVTVVLGSVPGTISILPGSTLILRTIEIFLML